MERMLLIVASIGGLLAVALGAFGAHGLKGQITSELLAAYQTAVQYQMFHSLALFALGVSLKTRIGISLSTKLAGYCWIVGMVLFSGSLYALALGGPSWLGPITPLGGLLLMVGWFSLLVSAWKA